MLKGMRDADKSVVERAMRRVCEKLSQGGKNAAKWILFPMNDRLFLLLSSF